MANTIYAGRIHGNPLNGLCERICIEVPKVFDGCMSRANNQNFMMDLSGISADAIPPFTYVSASNYGDANFEDLIITPVDNGCSRLIGDVVIPVLVTFCDSTGRAFSATGNIRVRRDIMLRLPQRTLIPYQIKTAAGLASSIGSFLNDRTVSITGCYVIVNKVVVMADVLVPTYGYCVYPQCVNCGDVCNELLTLPLFPPTNG